MIGDRTVLGIIPARGGSKGIPGKNLCSLGGKPLIQWTIEAAQQSQTLDDVTVSTDSDAIIKAAGNLGCKAPFVRPPHLATDESSSIDVIIHALDNVEKQYDYFVLLQPTCPFRTGADIDGIVSYAFQNQSDAVVSVSRLKKHPSFMYTFEGRYLSSFFPRKVQLRRQDMPAAYEHNGALYVATPSFIRRHRSFNAGPVEGYETRGLINIDIDEPVDLEYAEFMLKRAEQAHH